MTGLGDASVIRFEKSLSKYGIRLAGEDGIGNVVIRKSGMPDFRIACTQFYRISGKCILVKDGDKGSLIITPLSDDDFYKEVLAWVLIHFKIDKF